MCQKLYDALKAAKDSNGKSVTDPFIRVPSRRFETPFLNKLKSKIYPLF